jgi:hypothetical protein
MGSFLIYFYISVMKKLILLLLIVPMVSFGQTKLKLGDKVSFYIGDLTISVNKPIPFQQSNLGYGARKTTYLVASFVNKEMLTIMQIYSTPVPPEFALDSERFFSNKNLI